MNLQTVSATNLQRNIRSVLDNLNEPTLIIRDSQPVAVIQSVDDYLRAEELKKEVLKKEFSKLMETRSKATKKYSDKEIDRNIAEAINAIRHLLPTRKKLF